MNSQQSLTVQQNLAIRLLRVLRYNKARIERAIVLLPENRRPLFHVLPFLLHVNHPQLPGYIDEDSIVFGLNNYSLRNEVTESLNALFPELHELFADIKQIWPRQRAIDALVLMGSIGTIAQSEKSDFDYWVCVDGSALGPDAMQSLQKKCTAIETWAMQAYDIEVHFFLSDIESVRNNDFGVAEGESAGSAQAVFLKAEFYTTNMVVAGKAPFWWLMPENTTDQQYYALLKSLQEGGSPDPSWFMDLGNLERMDPNELFGAAIWQLSKAMDSPFKSVLKMAKLEVFLENLETDQPLCNLLRKRVHHGGEAPGAVANIDPYALMFDQLIEHYQSIKEDNVVLLLQQCLYIKCGCKLSQPAKEEEINFKRQIVAGYVKQWGWSRNELRHLDSIENWTFQEVVQLSRRIHQFLIQCYRRMSAKLSMDSQTVSREDMTVLGRRLDTFYSQKEDKIAFLRSGFDDKVYCSMITIKLHRRKNGQDLWYAFQDDQVGNLGKSLEYAKIYSAPSPVQLIVWCACNRVIDGRSKILLDYDTDPVVETDLSQLAKHCQSLFPPVRVSNLPRDVLLSPVRINVCMVVLNYTTTRLKASVEEVQVVYTTSWGETFLAHGQSALDKLWFELQEISPRPPCYVFVPQSSQRKRIYQEFVEGNELSFELLS